MKTLWRLGLLFLRIGCFMFGGGAAMLPLLQTELVERRQWLTKEKLMDYYSIAQSTPGIIAVNVATFTGYGRAGVWGAIVATLALITVPVIVILLLANVLSLYMDNVYVEKAFTGVRFVIVALIGEAVYKMWKTAVRGRWDKVYFGLALVFALAGVPVFMIMLWFLGLGLMREWMRGNR